MSPASRRTASTYALPETIAITVTGASSWTRSDHGGAIDERSRNAPRALGPSRSPAIASMRRDDDECIGAFQLWIVQPIPSSIPAMTTLVLGATGKTGRRICARLGDDVRRGSRATGFDWND